VRAIYVMVLSMCLFAPGCKCSISVDDRKREDLSSHSDLIIEIKNAIVSIPSLAHAEPSIEVIADQGVFCAKAQREATTIDRLGITITRYVFTAYGKDTKTALENLKEKLTSKKGKNSEAK